LAPIRIEKLPAPAPAADRTPSVMINPSSELISGVSAVPAASISVPAIITLTDPYLSAIAPKIGCDAPQTNWPTASAKLIDTMPRPVAVFSGDTKRPVVCRMPIVSIRIAAAVRLNNHTRRRVTSGGTSRFGDIEGPFDQRSENRQ